MIAELIAEFVLLLIIELAYIRLARKLSARSCSPSRPVSGAGIIFLPGILLALSFIAASSFAICLAVSLSLLAIICFIDDWYPLSVGLRLGTQLLLTIICLISAHFTFLSNSLLSLPMAILTAIFAIGFMNVYNFMDGINGMTTLYSLAVLLPMPFLGISWEIIMPIIIPVIIFSIFNLRTRAIAYAGDTGAILMGAAIAILLIAMAQSASVLVLAAIYITDAPLTIIYRLCQGKNIFKPHHEHLYEMLAYRTRIPHLLISSIYAAAQLCINSLFLLLPDEYMRMGYCVGVFILLIITWFIFRQKLSNLPEYD